MTTKTLIFESDPGHGWLLVTPEDLAEVGLTEADISSYSYRSRDGIIALEEDCDASAYLKAYEAKHGRGTLAFDERFRDPTPIRNWPSYGKKRSAA